MGRHIFQGTYQDGAGRVVQEGTISIYLAGTTTPADVYAASAGGIAVNSVESDEDTGHFKFFVDNADYSNEQHFKIVLSKTAFKPQTIDDIHIIQGTTIPHGALTLGHTTDNSQEIVCTSLDTWYPIEHASITWTVVSDDGITPDAATGGFTLPFDGDYLFMASFSLVGDTNNMIPSFSILIDDAYVAGTPISRRKMATATDVGSMTVMMDIHGATAGEVIKLGVKLKTGDGANGAGDKITIENASLFMQAIEV